jgi:hypothetical protein
MLNKFKLLIVSFAFVATAHCLAMGMEERHQMELNANLINAARQGNVKGVSGSLERGAEPNAIIENTSALIEAVKVGKSAMIEDLLDGGADINLKVNNQSPLAAAVASGKPSIVSLLLDRGARVGDDYESLKQRANNSVIVEDIMHAYIKELDENIAMLNKMRARVQASAGYTQEYLKRKFGK